MQAATRRNVALAILGLLVLLLLWQAPGRYGHGSGPVGNVGTPQPTPTVVTQWRVLQSFDLQGNQDLCAAGREIKVSGPWRLRAVPADREVQVKVIDKSDGDLFARVWAGGTDHGALAILPEGNGTYCLQIEAQGAYTLYVEAWEAPQA
jgi:hypothetical protein